MSVSSKVKALLQLREREQVGLAQHLGITKQALSNKFYRDSFSAVDLILSAEFLGCELAFIVDSSQKITLNKADIKNDEIRAAVAQTTKGDND
ncbi:MAG: helix-turn-helix domain containing protein [Synergistaceae bacterium]|nr:helix-turn-helix domain containing protein [Synergistaceae bacterium]